MATYDKYITTMKILRKQGYVEKANLNAIKNAMIESGLSFRENYQLKFHIQNIMSLGLVKDSNINNVFNLNFDRVDEYDIKRKV